MKSRLTSSFKRSVAINQSWYRCDSTIENSVSPSFYELNFDARIFVSVAQLTEGKNLLWQSNIFSVILARYASTNNVVFRSLWHFLSDLTGVESYFLAHTHASAGVILHIFPTKWPLCYLLRGLHAHSLDNDLSSILIALVGEISCPCLLLGSHELAHCDLYLANCVIVAATVAIDHHELVVLHLFKEVGQHERSLEVWIEWVLDLLSLANFDPAATRSLLE